jgi:exocyst complex component 8
LTFFFASYAEFVLISKEISTLENELLELKDLLSEHKSMPSLLNIPDPTTISSSTLSTYRRSSVADLRIMYYNQMQTLHTSIEGAAKFAPITPGRHIVSEMDGILSLNAATYKVSGKVKFVILDDAMLVARRRRRNTGNDSGGTSKSGSISSGKLVAEHCWPLNEMVVLDTKDSSSMSTYRWDMVTFLRYTKELRTYSRSDMAKRPMCLGRRPQRTRKPS